MFEPKFSFLDTVFASRKKKKIQEAEERYTASIENHINEVKQIEASNSKLQAKYDKAVLEFEANKLEVKKKFEALEKDWQAEKEAFQAEQLSNNLKIDAMKERYFQGDRDAVIHYCELVLNNSKYPDWLSTDFEIDYQKDGRMLLVEFVLPKPEDLPTLIEVKYVASKKEMKETHVSSTQLAKTYDEVIYKLTLRTLHELFEADQANVIDAIVFNGWVEAINKATGKKVGIY